MAVVPLPHPDSPVPRGGGGRPGLAGPGGGGGRGLRPIRLEHGHPDMQKPGGVCAREGLRRGRARESMRTCAMDDPFAVAPGLRARRTC